MTKTIGPALAERLQRESEQTKDDPYPAGKAGRPPNRQKVYFVQLSAEDRAAAWSGGSEPGSEIDPAAIAAMAEVGIDITTEFPKPWTEEILRAADVVVTMGCGDSCPICPGKRYLDWELADPAGQSVADVRPIRDDIETRVRALLTELGVPVAEITTTH